jgi:hypothetical protein
LEVIKGKTRDEDKEKWNDMEKVGKIGEKSEARKMHRFC